jgi:hypothetical protein
MTRMRLDQDTPWIDLCDVMVEDLVSLTAGDYCLRQFYNWLKQRWSGDGDYGQLIDTTTCRFGTLYLYRLAPDHWVLGWHCRWNLTPKDYCNLRQALLPQAWSDDVSFLDYVGVRGDNYGNEVLRQTLRDHFQPLLISSLTGAQVLALFEPHQYTDLEKDLVRFLKHHCTDLEAPLGDLCYWYIEDGECPNAVVVLDLPKSYPWAEIWDKPYAEVRARLDDMERNIVRCAQKRREKIAAAQEPIHDFETVYVGATLPGLMTGQKVRVRSIWRPCTEHLAFLPGDKSYTFLEDHVEAGTVKSDDEAHVVAWVSDLQCWGKKSHDVPVTSLERWQHLGGNRYVMRLLPPALKIRDPD